MCRACRFSPAAHGYTYIGLLVLVAIMGLGLTAAAEVWLTEQQREKERELLFIGNQFRQALDQYYRNTPGRALRYPLSLEDLLEDPRYPMPRRYLRKIYPDPMTRGTQWGLVTGPKGEIYGVHSLSEEAPLKKGNFKSADRDFEGKTRYSEWLFMHSGQ
ncbi:MAG: type II secretion system protein [Thiobacillus sp.]|nr:type II secretion system protein [Thiobacillus sp.]